MALEIERKFLVRDDSWRPHATGSIRIRQAYFAQTPFLRARIRICGERAFITLKSEPGRLVRQEFEYEIPKHDAQDMMRQFGVAPVITKVRHSVPFGGVVWTVDVFEGANSGLVMAEAELKSADQPLALPAWAGREVTLDPRYGNSNLARNPCTMWGQTGRSFGEADRATGVRPQLPVGA